MAEILQCPFCGGRAEQRQFGAFPGSPFCCLTCGAIADNWNTRALAPALRVVLDHVKRDGVPSYVQETFLFHGSAMDAIRAMLRAMLAEQEAGDD